MTDTHTLWRIFISCIFIFLLLPNSYQNFQDLLLDSSKLSVQTEYSGFAWQPGTIPSLTSNLHHVCVFSHSVANAVTGDQDFFFPLQKFSTFGLCPSPPSNWLTSSVMCAMLDLSRHSSRMSGIRIHVFILVLHPSSESSDLWKDFYSGQTW